MKAAKLVETSQKRQNHAPLAAFVQQERTELPQLQQDFLCRSTADQEDMDMEAKRLSVDVLTVFQAISHKNGKCYECGNVGHGAVDILVVRAEDLDGQDPRRTLAFWDLLLGRGYKDARERCQGRHRLG